MTATELTVLRDAQKKIEAAIREEMGPMASNETIEFAFGKIEIIGERVFHTVDITLAVGDSLTATQTFLATLFGNGTVYTAGDYAEAELV